MGNGGPSTLGLPRMAGAPRPYVPTAEADIPRRRDHAAGDFAAKVVKAKEQFKVGNLFETVLSQTFFEPCPQPPSAIFRRLRKRNPSPYGFLLNLGDAEYLVGARGHARTRGHARAATHALLQRTRCPDLPVPSELVAPSCASSHARGTCAAHVQVGASPEMFVRVERNEKGWRCETCPISGTIKRGANAMEDAEAIKTILADKKEESELTMCTDVDRNDKSRICEAGSVQVRMRIYAHAHAHAWTVRCRA